tara:strand:- start:3152 stop:3799 length:648 start_codon:yes stop_codon:yes gene_type:complete
MNDYLFTNINNLNHIILAVYVLLVVYIVFIIPKLNIETIKFFKRLEIKLITMLVIIYISVSNPVLAILLSLAFILTLQELNKKPKQIVQKETKKVQKETKKVVVKSNNKEFDAILNNTLLNNKEDKNLLKNDIIGNFSLDETSDSTKAIETSINKIPNNRVLDDIPAFPSLQTLDRDLPTSEVKTFKNQMGTQGLDNEITGYLSNSGIYGEASPF